MCDNFETYYVPRGYDYRKVQTRAATPKPTEAARSARHARRIRSGCSRSSAKSAASGPITIGPTPQDGATGDETQGTGASAPGPLTYAPSA